MGPRLFAQLKTNEEAVQSYARLTSDPGTKYKDTATVKYMVWSEFAKKAAGGLEKRWHVVGVKKDSFDKALAAQIKELNTIAKTAENEKKAIELMRQVIRTEAVRPEAAPPAEVSKKEWEAKQAPALVPKPIAPQEAEKPEAPNSRPMKSNAQEAVTIGELGTAAAEGKVGEGGLGDVKKEAKITGAISFMAPEVTEGSSNDGEKISSTLKVRIRSFADIYERELKRNPNLAGRVTVRFTVTSNGAVSDVRIDKDTMGNPAVGQGIIERLKHFKFPMPDGAVTVVFPFVFTKTQ
ncbi:MAG: TonB family protein [Candidatus Micrarchaeota archaeon]